MPTANLFAQEARPVAFLPLFQGAALLGCMLELRRGASLAPPLFGGAGPALLLVAACWLAIHTHPVSAFFVAAIFLTLGAAALTMRRLAPRLLLRWGVIGAAVLILSIPQIGHMASHATANATGWRGAFQPVEIPRTVVELLLGEGGFGWPVWLRLALAAGLLAIAGRGLLALEPPLRWALGGPAAIFLALVTAVSFATPLLMTRYVLSTTLPLAVLIAAGLCAPGLGIPLRRLGSIAVLGLLLVLSLRQTGRGTEGEWHNTQDWRGVTATISADAACHGPVYSNMPPGVTAWPYYDAEGGIGPRIQVRERETDADRIPFLMRETGYTEMEETAFRERLRAGGPFAVVLAGRIAERSAFARLVREEAGGPLVRHAFPPALTLLCVGPR